MKSILLPVRILFNKFDREEIQSHLRQAWYSRYLGPEGPPPGRARPPARRRRPQEEPNRPLARAAPLGLQSRRRAPETEARRSAKSLRRREDSESPMTSAQEIEQPWGWYSTYCCPEPGRNDESLPSQRHRHCEERESWFSAPPAPRSPASRRQRGSC